MSEPRSDGSVVSELVDHLADEWPDTPQGWGTAFDKYQLAGELVAVIRQRPDLLIGLLLETTGAFEVVGKTVYMGGRYVHFESVVKPGARAFVVPEITRSESESEAK